MIDTSALKGSPIFFPMPGKIVVRLITEEKIGNLILPISAQTQRCIGIVEAIGGDELEGDEYDLSLGDMVLFGRSSGIEATVLRHKVLILRTSEILCRIEWSTDD